MKQFVFFSVGSEHQAHKTEPPSIVVGKFKAPIIWSTQYPESE